MDKKRTGQRQMQQRGRTVGGKPKNERTKGCGNQNCHPFVRRGMNPKRAISIHYESMWFVLSIISIDSQKIGLHKRTIRAIL